VFTHKECPQGLVTAKRVPFVHVNGRMTRDNRGREVELSCTVKGSSTERFNTGYPIGFHKWY